MNNLTLSGLGDHLDKLDVLTARGRQLRFLKPPAMLNELPCRQDFPLRICGRKAFETDRHSDMGAGALSSPHQVEAEPTAPQISQELPNKQEEKNLPPSNGETHEKPIEVVLIEDSQVPEEFQHDSQLPADYYETESHYNATPAYVAGTDGPTLDPTSALAASREDAKDWLHSRLDEDELERKKDALTAADGSPSLIDSKPGKEEGTTQAGEEVKETKPKEEDANTAVQSEGHEVSENAKNQSLKNEDNERQKIAGVEEEKERVRKIRAEYYRKRIENESMQHSAQWIREKEEEEKKERAKKEEKTAVNKKEMMEDGVQDEKSYEKKKDEKSHEKTKDEKNHEKEGGSENEKKDPNHTQSAEAINRPAILDKADMFISPTDQPKAKAKAKGKAKAKAKGSKDREEEAEDEDEEGDKSLQTHDSDAEEPAPKAKPKAKGRAKAAKAKASPKKRPSRKTATDGEAAQRKRTKNDKEESTKRKNANDDKSKGRAETKKKAKTAEQDTSPQEKQGEKRKDAVKDEEDPAKQERKAKQSRKSAAYHAAYKKFQSLGEDTARARAKEVSWLNSWCV